ncbi:MAG: TetR/AcrR family transcriptional regulator [Actinomycetota bacterium]|nr:TetR/AcrR family transcriptional regulator [Actinomycetota bacterium]
MAAPSASSQRRTAEERREQVLEAALGAFAAQGLHGTSTEAIARRAGISQPYLFRLFGTKKELFLACARRCMDRTRETFRAAAETDGPEPILGRMGKAYIALLEDRELLLAQLQLQAACGDEEIRAVAREGYGELYREVERLSGASEDEVRLFFATGMLLNVAAAMDLPELADRGGWARRLMGDGGRSQRG